MKGGIFVDGPNLAHSLSNMASFGHSPRIDFRRFAWRVSAEITRMSGIGNIRFEHKRWYWSWRDERDKDRRSGYIHGLHEAGWEPVDRRMTVAGDGWREKGFDMMIALDAYEIALRDGLGVVTVVSGDADFEPLYEKLLARNIKCYAVAFKRAFPTHPSVPWIEIDKLMDRLEYRGRNFQ